MRVDPLVPVADHDPVKCHYTRPFLHGLARIVLRNRLEFLVVIHACSKHQGQRCLGRAHRLQVLDRGREPHHLYVLPRRVTQVVQTKRVSLQVGELVPAEEHALGRIGRDPLCGGVLPRLGVG